jgi:hypothetical protein
MAWWAGSQSVTGLPLNVLVSLLALSQRLYLYYQTYDECAITPYSTCSTYICAILSGTCTGRALEE